MTGVPTGREKKSFFPSVFVCLPQKICYNNSMESKKRQNSLFGELTTEKKAGLAYSAAAFLPVILSLAFTIVLQASGATKTENYDKSDWFIYCSCLLPQVAFAIVAAVFFFKSKTPVKAVAGKCAPKYFLIAVLLQVGLLSLAELNGLFLNFLGRFGYKDDPILLPSLNGFGLVGVLLTVAVLPAVFEETIFRGVVLGGLKSCGQAGAVLVCGALFSLYHENPAQTVYQFLCGAAYALVALRAGSILPTVLAHFLNNALIILLSKFGLEAFPNAVMIPLMIVSGLCLVGSLVWLIFFDKSGKREKSPARKGFFLCAAAGILVCAVMWISVLLTGFGK